MSSPDRAALLVYHDISTNSPASELPGWALAAVRTARALAGTLPAVLTTNSVLTADERLARPFHRIVRLDLMAESGLKGRPAVSNRALCGLKIWALLHGWREGLLGPQVLLLSSM